MQNEDDDILNDNFDSRSEGGLDIICNMIFVLPIEFDQVVAVTE